MFPLFNAFKIHIINRIMKITYHMLYISVLYNIIRLGLNINRWLDVKVKYLIFYFLLEWKLLYQLYLTWYK